MDNKKIVNIVQNTHWDYEWYFSQNESRINFEYFMKDLLFCLENNLFNQFVLDGQTGIIKDYLKNNPLDFQKIIQFNQANMLKIGPWYTQTDQMIIAGENIIKNLQLGINGANELGGAWKIAYCPDIFGQNIDMPQIYNQFGLKNMIFWRGLSTTKNKNREFIWKSLNGSKVNVLNIKEGYFNGAFLLNWPIEIRNKVMKKISANSLMDQIWFSFGSDQRSIDFNIKNQLETLNSTDENFEYKLANYEEVFKKYQDLNLEIFSGEMLDAQDSKIHRSIYSSRYDLKQLNNLCENKLINKLEPLLVMAMENGVTINRNIVDDIWKELVLNSAHDSAGACNTDKTNSHIKERFIRANELIDAYIDIISRKIAEGKGKTNDILLFNTSNLNEEKTYIISLNTKKENFKLFKNKEEIIFDVLKQEKKYAGSIKRAHVELNKDLYYYETKIAFKTFINQFSYSCLNIIENNSKIEVTIKSNENYKIINNYYEIEIKNNKINLLDKETKKQFNDFISILDQADDGDTYDFSPLKNDQEIILDLTKAKIDVENFNNLKTIKIDWITKLPKNIKNEKRNSELIDLKISLKLILIDNYLKFNLKINNTIKDHRMRIKFNSAFKNQSSFVDTPFGFVEREIEQKELKNWKSLGWYEEPTGLYPFINTIITKQEQKELAILTDGIKEYQFGNNGEIFLTLFRTHGWLGKPDLERRPGVASGQQFKWVPTPNSQLLKELEFNFAIILNQKPSAYYKTLANIIFRKDMFYQIQSLNRFTGSLRYFTSNNYLTKNVLLNDWILQTQIDENLHVSLLKVLDKKNKLIRLINLSNKKINGGQITFNYNGIVYFSDLKEQKINKITKENVLNLGEFNPREIKTFIIQKGNIDNG